ncbi:MAG: Rqc2 family fibronectin-binding protein, partial [Desulfofundulus sp.]
LAKAERAEEYRIFGELLMANLYRLEKGLSQVTLENFYDPERKMVTIPLDPRLNPVQNAQAYFKKYSKAKQTREKTGNRLEQTKRDLEYLKGIETAIIQTTTVPELLEIREELEEQGYLKPAGREKKREPEKPRPLVFTSSEGFTILVGRNNKQNDYLTLHLAKDGDIWLHTRDIPGSHVLIRTAGRTVPETTLAEAASLAAYFSRARESQNVPVDYTLCRNVHKPRGARPGYVVYTGQRTLTVNPDQELVEKLKA